jgi:TolB protein
MRNGATSRRAFVLSTAAILGGIATATSGTSWAEQPAAAANQRVVKIALPDFAAGSGGATDLAHQIISAVTEDLRTSGHVVLIDPAAIAAGDVDSLPQFGAWRSLGADVLVTGRVNAINDKLRTEFRLWDVAAGWQLMGVQYVSEPDHWPQVSHAISSAVYERLTGEKRDFDPGRP